MARLANTFMYANKVKMEELEGWDQRQWEQYWIESKIDGVRFGRRGGEWISSGGKEFHNVEHITTAIDAIPGIDDFFIDGELYADDWETTVSCAKTMADDATKTKRLRYKLFDCVPLVLRSGKMFSITSLDERRELLGKLFEKVGSRFISLVNVASVASFYEFMLVHHLHLASGCDGSMLKLRDSVYVPRRSSSWLKVKPATDMDCKIVDFERGEGKYTGTLGAIGVVIPLPAIDQTGKERWSDSVTHVSGMTDKERDYIWKNREKLLGMIVEVKYRRITVNDRMVEPRFNRIRWDIKT